MKIRIPCLGILVLVLATTVLGPLPASAVGPTGHTQVPTELPSTISPAVNDGQVQALVQVGTTMVIGGTFTNLTPKGGPATNRSGIATFDANTGALRAFNPVLNGDVNDVLEGPVPGTVYVAGAFTNVSGTSMSHLALLNVNTGAPVAGFKAPATNGMINTIAKSGNRLLLGGYFTVAGGQEHKGLAAIDQTSGVIDHGYMGIDVSERHNNSGTGQMGSIGVRDMETTPDGTRLAVLGNFRKADGFDRVQAMLVNLGTGSATVDANWRTKRFEPLCSSWAFDATIRGISVSPDGTWFSVASTGGGARNTLCDTAARFEMSSTGQDVQPTWIDSTGGDTLWSVEVTEKATYIGGHQRWQNNLDGFDSAGQGAVPRPGLAALDNESGVPIEWNPGRLPRGLAVFEIYASPTGLWMGSDTDYFGNFQHRRPKVGYFPLSGGYQTASDQPASLPGDVYMGSRTLSPAVANNLSTFSFNGTSAPTAPTVVNNRGVSWDSVRGAFMLGNTLFYGKTDGYLYKREFTKTTTGSEVKLDPYNDPQWNDAQDGVGGTLRGKVPTLYGQLSSVTGMFAANDRVFFTRNGDSNLYWRWFNADSGIVGSHIFTANGGRSWTDTGGLFRNGNTLYIVSKSTGRLQRMTFTNNAPSGSVTTVDQSRDWRSKVMFIGPGDPVANVPPTASFTVSCEERTCTVNGAGSTDSDGGIVSYAWNFGDNGTANGATPPPHVYAADGSYPITLTVTDSAGATGTSTQTVDVEGTPPPPSDLSFVGQNQTSTQGSTATPSVAIPAGVQPGDRLILVGSYGASPVNPTTPAGWNAAGSRVASAMESHVWTRTAVTGDAGTVVTTPLGASMKSTLTVAAYRGVASAGGLAAVASSTDGGTMEHTSPTVGAPAGGWVVQLWSDKSSGTTDWTQPGGVTVRGESYGGGTGRTSALLTDSGGPVSVGTYGGQMATTDANSGRAIAWTIALKAVDPGGANQDPQASFTAPCTLLTCTVDGSSSSDDGSIVSHEWDFGDTETDTGATPAPHTYDADGIYTITLKVTDNNGATDTATQQVNVAGTPPSSSLSFVAQAMNSGNSTSQTVTIPAGVQAGDQLLLIGGYGVAGATPTPPAGWTLQSQRSNGALEGFVWTKRAVAGDAGSTVSTPTGALMKSALAVAAYRGVADTGGVAAVESSADSSTNSHASPAVTAPGGAWVVQAWTDKAAGTQVWSAPTGVTERGTISGVQGSGQHSLLLVDSGGPVNAGSHGGQTATTSVVSGKAVAWSIVLVPLT